MYLILNWVSLVPIGYKMGLVKCLLDRAYSSCASWEAIHKQFECIRDALHNNGYPNNIIDKCLDSVLNKHVGDKIKPVAADPKPRLMLKLPYCGDVSVRLKKTITKVIQKALS